jgi:hypothetical protein
MRFRGRNDGPSMSFLAVPFLAVPFLAVPFRAGDGAPVRSRQASGG